MKFNQSGKSKNCVGISVDIIDPDPNQPREETGFDTESLEVLANTMVLSGQEHPCLVRRSPVDENRWMLVSGERRWRAAKLRGLPTVDCVQYTVGKDIPPERHNLELMFAMMAGNIHVQPSDSELSKFFIKMIGEGATVSEIASRTGYKESFIRSITTIEKAPEQIQRAVKEKKMSRTAAADAARAPEPARRRIEQRIDSGKRVKVADVQEATKGHATMIPASKIERIISICIANRKATSDDSEYMKCESEKWDEIACFLGNHILGNMEVEVIFTMDKK